MATNLGLTAPARVVKPGPVISSRRGRKTVLIMVVRARMALADQEKFDSTIEDFTNKMLTMGNDQAARDARQEIAAYLCAKQLKIFREITEDGERVYALRWDESDKRFNLVLVPHS